MGHPEPKTIKEPKIKVTVEVDYQEPVKFTDEVDMGEVPEGKYTPPPDAGSGGSYTEPTILGTHHSISGNFASGTDAVISNNITIPSGGAGTYEIEAKIQYLLTGGTSNQVISLVKNGTVLTGVLASDTFTGEGNGVQSHFVKYYLNSLIVGDIIGINFNSSISGTGNNSVCQLTLKKLQNTVTITPTNDSAAGGA